MRRGFCVKLTAQSQRLRSKQGFLIKAISTNGLNVPSVARRRIFGRKRRDKFVQSFQSVVLAGVFSMKHPFRMNPLPFFATLVLSLCCATAAAPHLKVSDNKRFLTT